MDRTFLLASALKPQAAARAAAEAPEPIDLVVTSPSALAREAAAIAVGGRWVFTIDEPLLAPQSPGESGGDVLSRLAQALRTVHALDARAPLIVCDGLDILGAGAFVLDEEGVARCGNELERLLPPP
ncbi:MAG TPA: hypothetical protein VHH55_07885 [Gaiellaceae bacterium]|nr:hypothetical protein [Gaiellaceae bacterium]